MIVLDTHVWLWWASQPDKLSDSLLSTSTQPATISATCCSCYSMSMPLERRLQVLLDEDRHRRLAAVAAERGVSVATVVREAIDRGLPASDGRRRTAGQRVLDAVDMPVGEPDQLVAELNAVRDRRG